MNTIKTALPQKYDVDSIGSHYPSDTGSFYFADEIEPIIADLRAALAAKEQPVTLPTWIDEKKGSDPYLDRVINWIEQNVAAKEQRDVVDFTKLREIAHAWMVEKGRSLVDDWIKAAGESTPPAEPVADGGDAVDATLELSPQEQKLSERVTWNLKQWYEHVGSWEDEKDQITFGSVMALRAMLLQFQAVTLHKAAHFAQSVTPVIGHSDAVAWHMVCADWKDEHMAIHGPSGHIASGLTVEQAKAIIDAHGGNSAVLTASGVKP